MSLYYTDENGDKKYQLNGPSGEALRDHLCVTGLMPDLAEMMETELDDEEGTDFTGDIIERHFYIVFAELVQEEMPNLFKVLEREAIRRYTIEIVQELNTWGSGPYVTNDSERGIQ